MKRKKSYLSMDNLDIEEEENEEDGNSSSDPTISDHEDNPL